MRAPWRELAHAHRVAGQVFATVAHSGTRFLAACGVVLGCATSAGAQASAGPADAAIACATCVPLVPPSVTGGVRLLASDTTGSVPANVRPRPRSRLPYVFFGVVAAGVVANTVIGADQDPGGYQDTWGSEAAFPDKVVHGLAAFALTSVGVDLKVRPLFAAITTCAAGAIFETTQGYISSYDIAADCAGAAVAGLWRHWRATR